MTAFFSRIALIAFIATLAAPAFAQNDPVVAKVNGTEIRQSDLTAAEEDIGPNLPPTMQADAKRDYLITYVTDMHHPRQGGGSQASSATAPTSSARSTIARNKLLMEALLDAEAKTAVTEAAMRKVYEEATKAIGEEKEVRARHILVEKEDEAKAILADLKKGGDFVAIAKEKSKDPGSKDNGGDLGYFTKDQMVPEFAEAAFKLDKDQLSDPIKTQFGWHVIKVEDKRSRQAPEFEKVKDQVEQYVVRKAQSDLVTKLRSEAKIEKTPPATRREAGRTEEIITCKVTRLAMTP